MPKWVSQTVVSSVSDGWNYRFRHLMGHKDQVDAAIRLFFEQREKACPNFLSCQDCPECEAVTPFVFLQIGPTELAEIAKDSMKSLGSVNQDLGRFIAIRMVESYGAERVETLRSGTGARQAHPRSAPMACKAMFKTFTPHRLRA